MEIFSLYRQVLMTSEKTTVCNRAYNAPKTFFILLMLSVFIAFSEVFTIYIGFLQS